MEAAMTAQLPTLEKRIFDALQPDAAVTSADLAALIEEAEIGISTAEKHCEVDQTLALDPNAARQAIADATFAANRLRTLLSKLQARYQQLQYQDEVAAWHADADVRESERDELSEELRKVLPDAWAKVTDLFVRMIAHDEALSELHQARPAGVHRHLLSAELHARGLNSFTRATPSLLTLVHLIDLESGRQVWPPPRRSIAAAFAAAEPPHDSRRFSADWAMDNERRAAAQEAERQRIAEFYAQQTRQQEDRENAEARERFAALQRKKGI
jgi:hypothetical protein